MARHSIRSMALLLSRSPSTVSREVRRNGGYDQYRAALADDMAWARARRPKRCKLALSSGMRRVVAMKLGLNLVTGADRRMAQASASRSWVLSGVSRDDLSQFVCSSPRCA